ncbi:hypothetical protein PF003_g30649 [Phytophthora fragariae]|nr:hypothetical protein PF003_g30649 [Phytophthora fragariae]
MTTQSTSAARLHRVLLVAVVTLMASAGALVVATDSKGVLVNSETSHYGFGAHEAKRRLRSRIQPATHEANDFENRGFDFSISGIINKLSKNPSNQFEAENLFVKLNLAGEGSKLFESPQFQTWSTRVVKGYKQNSEAAEVAIAATLTRRLGDDALAKLIVEAQDVASTKSFGCQVGGGAGE